MEKRIIITLPRYDDTTEYLSQWSYKIEEIANDKDVKIKKLLDEEANKDEFEKVIKKLNYKIIIFNGHGSSNSICGNNGGAIVTLGVNEYLLRDRITYARACDAAITLGNECVKDNNGVFIGYIVPLCILY